MVSPYDINWKPLFSARVTLNKLACRLGITAIFDNITQCSFISCLWYLCQSPFFGLVVFLLYITLTRVAVSLMFVIFSSNFTICNVAP